MDRTKLWKSMGAFVAAFGMAAVSVVPASAADFTGGGPRYGNLLPGELGAVAGSAGLKWVSSEIAAPDRNPQAGPVRSSMQDGVFDIRGFCLDLRNQVMTLDAIKAVARESAAMGLNTLVLEYEATYPYQKHATIANDVAYTRQEIRSLIDYCQSVGIDVIPLQECFGHVQYILRHDRYNHLSEDPKDLSQVCPLKREGDSLLFQDLFADMAAMHPSKYVHIGGDETLLLGHDAACREAVAKEGKSKLFVDYMAMMSRMVLKMGKIPVMWADMILKHPEAAELLPKETILLDWNYGWKPNHFGDIEALQAKGFKFWGAASIRSHPDNWYVTEWMTHFNNQRDYIPFARERGYEAMLMTSWSTSGLYSFTWDVKDDVQDMEPIRNNYPMSGFGILMAAYAQSLRQSAPLDPHSFVVEYAGERFGLSKADGEALWETFTMVPELLVHGKPQKSADIGVMIEANAKVQRTLNRLNPTLHPTEFAHFRLMADLRAYYLSYKQLLARYNAPDFSIDKVGALLKEVTALLDSSGDLDARFTALNEGFLKEREIERQNMVRNRPVWQLFNRLDNLK